PADGAGEVHAGDDLLAAVPLQVDEHGGLVTGAALAAPLGDGQGQAGQQHVVDAAVEGGGDLGEERAGDVGGQVERQVPGRAERVGRRVEGPGAEDRVGGGEHVVPQRQLSGPDRPLPCPTP